MDIGVTVTIVITILMRVVVLTSNSVRIWCRRIRIGIVIGVFPFIILIIILDHRRRVCIVIRLTWILCGCVYVVEIFTPGPWYYNMDIVPGWWFLGDGSGGCICIIVIWMIDFCGSGGWNNDHDPRRPYNHFTGTPSVILIILERGGRREGRCGGGGGR